MRKLRFAREADGDLDAIAEYSVRTWGVLRAARYMAELENCCQSIAENPLLGRDCDQILPGLHRLEQGKHVIFYLIEKRGVLVVRVLHERMLPERWITGGIDASFADS